MKIVLGEFFLVAVLAISAGSGVIGTRPAQAGEERAEMGEVIVTGVRATQGDAVECPKIRDAAGRLHPVSYLSPTIPIGATVTVKGRYAIMTTCLGKVIHVEEVTTTQ